MCRGSLGGVCPKAKTHVGWVGSILLVPGVLIQTNKLNCQGILLTLLVSEPSGSWLQLFLPASPVVQHLLS